MSNSRRQVLAGAACLCKDGLRTMQMDHDTLRQLVAVSDRSSNRRLHFLLASPVFTAVLFFLFCKKPFVIDWVWVTKIKRKNKYTALAHAKEL